ncbi:DNA polymerase III subunit gamma/tau [Uliginosibacterium sp. H1]|uniref:DNA polymerase III subunit gamma/tau n=1 Tax=Uliginosibacterium sp. H1 TaxID=3114757 RepID=UPI002E16F3FB|nr:DNA polymerase III subunit gamma/tau [Uliginosibacterium sp. H1]
MSYQVLARKWRPRSFETLVGQDHVVRALSHALQTQRLHHAYLFTGTRGVGKTTISRILAKSLNCETGITATPCGQCVACLEIDAGRFTDYVEMDAASNRGVDDMASLLEKAAYAPARGRYKVYMIDEVHMLTGHAFNAMLKTLEEPPEHMKFILATTDPQKIPVTVLSRCLQFNLKQMPQTHIVDHLTRLLQAEAVPFEPHALRHIAKGANGSMRDALSLLDQAIAHGAGKVEEEGVRDMLGTVGEDHLYELLDALRAQDIAALLAVADGMEARSLSFDSALQEFAVLLHRVALAQFAPQAVADPLERERLQPYAEAFDPEFLQLAYQIVTHSREELAIAPDEYTGFTMALLRLHAFRPEVPGAGGGARAAGGGGGQARGLPAASRPVAAAPVSQASAASAPAAPATAAAAIAVPAPVAPAAPVVVKPAASAPPPASRAPAAQQQDEPPAYEAEQPPLAAYADEPGMSAGYAGEPPSAQRDLAPIAATPAADDVTDWHELIHRMRLGGMVRELAQNCELLRMDGAAMQLRLAPEHRHLAAMAINTQKLQEAVTQHFGRPMRVNIEIGAVQSETLAQRNDADKRQRHAEAVASLEADPFVQELIERFDATLIEASVKPLQGAAP